MITDRERKPAFSGEEHLQIFARPSTPVDERRHALRIGGERAPPGVDTTPISSIAVPPPAAPPPADAPQKPARSERVIDDASLRGVFNGRALVQTPKALMLVGPGDRIPEHGAVLLIEQAQTGPRVVTEGGVITKRK
jgi:hypothetical protein